MTTLSSDFTRHLHSDQDPTNIDQDPNWKVRDPEALISACPGRPGRLRQAA
jgi:hypothetical protein